jgi:hypothetical protein
MVTIAVERFCDETPHFTDFDITPIGGDFAPCLNIRPTDEYAPGDAH